MKKGYKVFNPDWTCRDYQFEVDKTYEIQGEPVLCKKGFHFCEKASDCFSYYNFDSKNKVAEVIAHGTVVTEGNKSCTNKIEIVREIPWQELLTIVNTGKDNTGLSNSGDSNSGYRNSGYRNSGDSNSGYRNSGDWNSGNYNEGDYCTGDFNLSDYSAGVFCTEVQKIKIFDTETDMTLEEWRNTEAYEILCRVEKSPIEWIWQISMTEEEKASHPEHKTTEGYLKKCDTCNAYANWWSSLDESEKQIIKNIPNYDSEKFEKITGIKI